MATWWDVNYGYYKQITISGGSVNAPTDFTVALTIDHAALVSAGKSQADGDDIRIVYWNGSANVELDRRLDDESSWNNSATKIWFKTKAAINASATDNNYYVYYGYSSAVSPPTTWSGVWFFYDDFSSSLDTTTRWTSLGGTPTVTDGALVLNSDGEGVWAKTEFAYGVNYKQESMAKIAYTILPGELEINSATNNSGWTDDFVIMYYYTNAVRFYTDTVNEGTYSSYYMAASDLTNYHKFGFIRNGATNVTFYKDDVLKTTSSTNLPNESLRTTLVVYTISGYTGTIYVDWIRVRQWLTSEPTMTLGTEQAPAAAGTNMQINIGDAWKTVESVKVNIGDTWKDVSNVSVNIGDAWKTVF